MNQSKFSKFCLQKILRMILDHDNDDRTRRSQLGDKAECLSDSEPYAQIFTWQRVVSTCYSPDGEWNLCISKKPSLSLDSSGTPLLHCETGCCAGHAAPPHDVLLLLALLARCPPQGLWINQVLLAPVQCNCSLLTNGHQREMQSRRCW